MQYESEMAIANQPFSAGVMDVECHEMLSELRSELEDEKAEHSVMKAYYRQVDDAYSQEAEEVAELMKQIQEKAENKMAGDSGKKSKDKTDPKDGKAGKSRSVSPDLLDLRDHLTIPRITLLQVFHHHGEAQLMLMTICLSRTSLWPTLRGYLAEKLTRSLWDHGQRYKMWRLGSQMW